MVEAGEDINVLAIQPKVSVKPAFQKRLRYTTATAVNN